MQNEIPKKSKVGNKKITTINASIIKYEKKHLCKHKNTDIAGTLLKNPLRKNPEIFLNSNKSSNKLQKLNKTIFLESIQKLLGKKAISRNNSKITLIKSKLGEKLSSYMDKYEKSLDITLKSLEYYLI